MRTFDTFIIKNKKDAAQYLNSCYWHVYDTQHLKQQTPLVYWQALQTLADCIHKVYKEGI